MAHGLSASSPGSPLLPAKREGSPARAVTETRQDERHEKSWHSPQGRRLPAKPFWHRERGSLRLEARSPCKKFEARVILSLPLPIKESFCPRSGVHAGIPSPIVFACGR
jgi:hypothetical protein